MRVARRRPASVEVAPAQSPDRPLLPAVRALAKTPTGIRGLDEITRGGLPRGRPTLVCGGPGSGKTLLALTFLVNGAVQFGEPGVLLTFEENGDEIANDVAGLRSAGVD
jgi:circadian clock protein KaiC